MEYNVSVNSYPQKIATAIGTLKEQPLLGVEYEDLAYLGSEKGENSTEHAVLAQQTVITGKDTKNLVLLIFEEKNGEAKADLVDVRRILKSGPPIGGLHIDASTDIPEDAKKDFDKAFEKFVGSKVEPFAYIGSQIKRGTDYVFAVTVTSITKEPVTKVKLAIVNTLAETIGWKEIFKEDKKIEITNLVGKPLGEWP